MKAALYIRVSTEEQAQEGYSLDAQEQKLLMYCHDVVDDLEVYRIYRDDGFSGRTINRPAYRQMMEDIDEWDLLLVMKMDRIHRNTRNFMLMMDQLVKKHKEFRSATEDLDTTTAMGRFVVTMIQNIAQLESEQIGERTKVGMTEKAETLSNTPSASRTMGFNPPFGYLLDNGLLVPVEKELRVVSRIYDDYLEGNSLAHIAEGLNRDGIRTKRGTRWSKDSLSTVLHNPIYAGYLRWDGTLSRHYATAPVNVLKFNEVQKLAALRAKHPGQRSPDIINEEGETAGLLKIDDFDKI